MFFYVFHFVRFFVFNLGVRLYLTYFTFLCLFLILFVCFFCFLFTLFVRLFFNLFAFYSISFVCMFFTLFVCSFFSLCVFVCSLVCFSLCFCVICIRLYLIFCFFTSFVCHFVCPYFTLFVCVFLFFVLFFTLLVCLFAAELMKQLNRSVDPCEDFYQFACGGWMNENALKEGETSLVGFSLLSDKIKNVLNKTLQQAPQTYADVSAARYWARNAHKQIPCADLKITVPRRSLCTTSVS